MMYFPCFLRVFPAFLWRLGIAYGNSLCIIELFQFMFSVVIELENPSFPSPGSVLSVCYQWELSKNLLSVWLQLSGRRGALLHRAGCELHRGEDNGGVQELPAAPGTIFGQTGADQAPATQRLQR